MLQAMGEMLQACTSPLEGARVASQFAQTLFDADAGTIFVVEDGDDPRRPVYRALYQWGPPSECDDHMHAEDCWALRKAKPYPLSDEEEGLRCQHLRLNPTRHGLCLPLNAQGRVLGLINLRGVNRLLHDSSEHGDHQLKLAQMFASKTAQFLANLTLRQRLEEQSLRDPLTGLFNRRYFSEQLNIEFQRALRAKTPLAALMIDVDHFKRINDRFGHETGDRVLKAIAEVLQQNARAGDIVCRWGGEEFVILMPGSNGQAARRRADEIRNRIKDQIDVIGGARVSVSIGVAAYPEHACDPDGLIEVSDRALYAAKGAGRNRVTVAVAGV
jgi:diguanylate cyclase (GGDEF)-like protein